MTLADSEVTRYIEIQGTEQKIRFIEVFDLPSFRKIEGQIYK